MTTHIDLEFLRQEYFHLQKTVEDFDQRALLIKSWSVTVSLAGLIAAFTEKMPVLFLLSTTSALLFWIIEALWKKFQLAYYQRIRVIEAYMRNEAPADFTTPDISRSWSVGIRQYALVRIVSWPHVFLPHAIIVVLGLVSWLINLAVPLIPR